MKSDSVRTIFSEALDRPVGKQREQYLRDACNDDPEKLSAVKSLLLAADLPDNLLDNLPPGLAPLADVGTTRGGDGDSGVEDADDVGRTIGDYKIMEKIGEGGFGLVYVAAQEKPVQRRVALKILRPGMGTKEVLARFDAERQAVAIMEHPNIAKVFDAGVTEGDGRPYFVMELVRGLPLTKFCDANQSTLRERLQLIEDLCAATQHAHQKGIIHRDLKPSNVLVTQHGDKAVIKVIDFGVAKALETSLTDQTIYTRFYSMIGTPLYMSPEQAAMSGLDVDTRSDIYSLGVMLYELLTGTTPFDRTRMDSAGYDEMRRIIREEDPPKPSSRLTTIRDSFSTVAGKRDARPTTPVISGPLPSDLDWIVMKAIEKDRDRRYESAAALAADLRRFTLNEPIEARPPSKQYLLRKFVRRNQASFITGSLVAVALLIGIVTTVYQAMEAIDEKKQKEDALAEMILAKGEVEGFAERLKNANTLVEEARSFENSGDLFSAEQVYSQAVRLVPNYYLVWLQRASVRNRLEQWDDAASDFAAATKLDAPYDTRQWQAATAILALGGELEALQSVYRSLDRRLDATGGRQEWSIIRSSLATPRPRAIAKRCVGMANELLRRDPGRPGRPGGSNGPGGYAGPPPRPGDYLDRLSHMFDGRQGDGRPNGRDGGGGGREGDWRRGGRRGGPPEGMEPRPHEQERLPRGVQHFIAAWAHLRADEPQTALDQIQLAQNDRGWPGMALTLPLAAMAHEQLGRHEEAVKFLAEAESAIVSIEPPTFDGQSGPGSERSERMPWFDIAELLLLYQEASEVVLSGDVR